MHAVPVSPRMLRAMRALAVLAAVFAFGVVMFGAFVRLSNAGLSCPDWPTCYGKATWPQHAQAVAKADAAFPDRPFDDAKAWREQVHRMLAGTLGTGVLALALLAGWRDRRTLAAVIVGALCAIVGVASYMHGMALLSGAASLLAIGLPTLAALALARPGAWRIVVFAFAVVVFQAMLGMWTVTLLLKPIVVLGHLLGGIATFSLLAWTALRLCGVGATDDRYAGMRRAVVIGIVLLAAQIALGGWTSSNYAALACGTDFPKCLGQWMPPADFRQAFVFSRGVGVDYEGGVLDMAARSAIQIAHRCGALVVFCYFAWLAFVLARRGLRGNAIAIGVVLLAQVALGISNVMLGLPLAVAVAHNGVASLLMFTLLATLARMQPRYLLAPAAEWR